MLAGYNSRIIPSSLKRIIVFFFNTPVMMFVMVPTFAVS